MKSFTYIALAAFEGLRHYCGILCERTCFSASPPPLSTWRAYSYLWRKIKKQKIPPRVESLESNDADVTRAARARRGTSLCYLCVCEIITSRKLYIYNNRVAYNARRSAPLSIYMSRRGESHALPSKKCRARFCLHDFVSVPLFWKIKGHMCALLPFFSFLRLFFFF